MADYYKVLDAHGHAFLGEDVGCGPWSLPVDGQPDDGWVPPVTEDLVERGYRVYRLRGLVAQLGPVIWECEVAPDGMIDDGSSVVVRSARLAWRTRWDERRARLFAADCAERVLPIFESARPGDDRPREAIRVAREYAQGQASPERLRLAEVVAWAAARAAMEAAAGNVAWGAAGAAAADSARAAMWAAEGGPAGFAVWDVAAGFAAWDAARVYGGNAAGDLERSWQTQRLAHYLYAADAEPPPH